MLNGRKRTASFLATLCITAMSGSMLAASPTFAEPDIQDVQARVDSLYEQAEQASERYNDARIELDQAKTRLRALRADLSRQQQRVDAVRTEVAQAVVSQYQGQALSTTTQVLLAKDPDSFLDQIATVSGYNDQQAEMMADFAVQAKQLEMREAAAQRELDRIAKTEKTLADEKAEIDEKAAEANELLDRLEDRAAAATVSRGTTRVPNVTVSGNAGAAVQYALAQVGDAYVYGAAGSERVRLLRPDDDGLGPGRRQPAALLERAAELRHSGVAVAARPRRPRLLLSAGEPRRHLHRQRSDRARREPLLGR